MCQLVQGSNNMWLSIFSLCVMAAFAVTSIDSKVQDDWWTHGVFYQIYPRSFMDSDGDGVGDLKGIISKLSYLAETGITATWLSPIFQSPMVDFGYDISNFATIHSEFGTMADFEQLIEEATRLDIKIFLDFVPNHSSDQCEWFLKSIDRVEGYEDFYVWADGKLNADNVLEPPNNWPSVFYGSAWTYNEKRKQYYLHQFTAEQPDLNFRNPKVIEAMNDVMIFWLNKGVAGFRVDAVNHLFEDTELRDEPLSGQTNDSKSYDYTKKIYTKNLPEVLGVLQRWRELLDDYTQKKGGPTRIMMSEAYTDVKTLMDYYENVDGLKSSHFPFNFLLITDLDKTSDARDFVFNIQKWLTYMPRGYVANWVLGNHDMSRVASRYGPERVDALNMLLMTLPGVAVTYNGDEIGMEDYRDISWEDTVDPPARNSNPIDYKNISRDPVRTPFQWDDTLNAGFSSAAKTWLPVHPNYKTLNLAQQKTDNFSHYKVYTHLVGLRKMPTLRYGRFSAEALSREVFAYKRELKGNPTVIVIINVSSAPQIVDLTAFGELSTEMKVLAFGSESVLEIGDTISTADLNLQPYEGLVCQY